MNNSLLAGTYNTRDIGGYQTKDGVLRLGVLWRSDRQIALEESDIDLLRQRGFTTVIDMRSAEETAIHPNVLAGQPGIDYHSLPIVEGSKAPDSPEAVTESYMNIACAKSMAEVFRTVARAPGSVLYGCAAGKDRTGVVTAVIHMLCGVGDEDIVHDYMLTRVYCEKELRAYTERHPEFDIDIILPREVYIREFMRQFRERFGTAEDYLSQLGLTPEETGLIKSRLIG